MRTASVRILLALFTHCYSSTPPLDASGLLSRWAALDDLDIEQQQRSGRAVKE